ncbi:MAG TPA: flagellar assembly protein FliH [Burkholderiaceae bacterium]
MGAFDHPFARTISKDELGAAESWQLKPLAQTPSAGRPSPMSARAATPEREGSAFERGRRQGYTEAMQIVQQARAGDIVRLDLLLAGLNAQFEELTAGAADAVLDLAIEIARQLVRRDIGGRRDAALPVVREALAAIADYHNHPRVHLAPQDFELVRSALEPDGLYRGCSFVCDPGIEPGGCRVESESGDVDATLSTRWARTLGTLGVEAADAFCDGDGTPAAAPARGPGRPGDEAGNVAGN